MISPRANALLQAAATIYAGFAANPTGPGPDEGIRGRALDDATALLSLIEAREKAHYKSQEVPSDDGA